MRIAEQSAAVAVRIAERPAAVVRIAERPAAVVVHIAEQPADDQDYIADWVVGLNCFLP